MAITLYIKVLLGFVTAGSITYKYEAQNNGYIMTYHIQTNTATIPTTVTIVP